MKSKLISITLIIFMLLSLVGCGVDEIDISSVSDNKINIIGIKDEAFEITVQDLANLKCITKKTHSTSDKIGKVEATGPLLNTFLAQYSKDQSDFEKIIFTAKDGYSIYLNKKFLSENKVILAFGIDGKPLAKNKAPLRLIIPKSDSSYWVNQVTEIKFISNSSQ